MGSPSLNVFEGMANIGAQIAREAASKTNDVAGDGRPLL